MFSVEQSIQGVIVIEGLIFPEGGSVTAIIRQLYSAGKVLRVGATKITLRRGPRETLPMSQDAGRWSKRMICSMAMFFFWEQVIWCDLPIYVYTRASMLCFTLGIFSC